MILRSQFCSLTVPKADKVIGKKICFVLSFFLFLSLSLSLSLSVRVCRRVCEELLKKLPSFITMII